MQILLILQNYYITTFYSIFRKNNINLSDIANEINMKEISEDL